MAKRTITALLLLAVAMPAVLFGGMAFFLLIGFFIVVASREYVIMFRAAGAQPSAPVVIGGTALLLTLRGFFPEWAGAALSGLVLVAMAVHLYAYERGRDHAAMDLAVTIAGFVYLGWIGAYLVDLRNLPEGGWWLMLVLPCVWGADTGAYVIGSKYGKHKMAPRLSPKKSWEGYIAGIVMGTYVGALFTWAFNVNTFVGRLTISPWEGAALGFVLSVIPTLGDLGESMFKRQGHIKDSGAIIPGHGGAFDRIDSWLWGAVIGVYWIRFFFL